MELSIVERENDGGVIRGEPVHTFGGLITNEKNLGEIARLPRASLSNSSNATPQTYFSVSSSLSCIALFM